MTHDIQFLIECLAAELTEMLMTEYGWVFVAPLTNCIPLPLSSSSTIPNVGYTIKVPSIYSNFSSLKLKPAKSHKLFNINVSSII